MCFCSVERASEGRGAKSNFVAKNFLTDMMTVVASVGLEAGPE